MFHCSKLFTCFWCGWKTGKQSHGKDVLKRKTIFSIKLSLPFFDRLLPGMGVIFFLLMATHLFAQEERAGGFFSLRSQSPIQQLRVGIQHHLPWTVPEKHWALHFQYTWKNMWLYDEGLFRVDGEVLEWVFRSAYGITDRWEVMAEIPVRYLTGGILDGLIEWFHDTFGYSQAGREKYPRNQFAVEIYVPETDTRFRLDASEVGWQLGNLVFSTTYALTKTRNQKFRAVLTGNIKFPTATTQHLFGSQNIDLGCSLGMGYDLTPLHIYYNAGFLYYGDKEVMGILLRQWHLSMLLAFEYRKSGSRHSWIFQGLVESGVAVDYNEFAKRTSEILLGYKHYYQSGWTFGIGILENIFYYDNSPDVALHLELTRIF